MKKFESDDICARCGDTYGNHAWLGDYCPSKEQIEKNKAGGTVKNTFNKKNKFKLKEALK